MQPSNEMYMRQADIFAREKAEQPIVVVGAGSLGSWAVLGLAKLGFKNITVYDDDKVELHNIPNQYFTVDDEGEFKAEALRENVQDASGIRITAKVEKFLHQMLWGLVIVTPDNMATRRQVFLRCRGNMNVGFFLDGRMGGQSYRTYAVDPNKDDQADYYLRHWYSDEEGSREPCTAKGVGYNAAMCAMELVNLAKRYVLGQECPREIVADSMGMWRQVNW